MCRSKAEGPRRCEGSARGRARARELADLCPGAGPDGRPAVDWNVNTSVQDLINKYGPAAEIALDMLSGLHDVEPDITTDVIESIPEGATPHSLQYRMKSPQSLADKLLRKAEAVGLPPAEVAGGMTDLVRYTAVTPAAEQLVGVAEATVEGLVSRGWTVLEAEHSFVEENPYKGLHVLLRHPSGTVTEVQFHSQAAIAIKGERGHHDYELERDINANLTERALARERMVEMWREVDTPPGVEDLKLGGVQVQRKVYPQRPAYAAALQQRKEEQR